MQIRKSRMAPKFLSYVPATALRFFALSQLLQGHLFFFKLLAGVNRSPSNLCRPEIPELIIGTIVRYVSIASNCGT